MDFHHDHNAEPSINILLTRNLQSDSDIRHWSHLLMISLHYLWAKSNNRTRGQFERDKTCNYARCGCCSKVCLRFQVVQTKQVDYKKSTKNVKISWYYWTTADTKVWRHEKADSEASAKWKEVKGKPDKINELILRTKADLKEGIDNI